MTKLGSWFPAGACAILLMACASPQPQQHGTITTLSVASSRDAQRCSHKVPQEVCTRCNPALAPKFKAAKDWCGEHEVPESQCFACHPDLTFDPVPQLPPGADAKELSSAGEDVPSLEPHAVRGKVTVFDFYAVWCAPCRKVDAHMAQVLRQRTDVAIRKLNVVSWQTPLATRYLRDVPTLPYVVVYGKDGKPVRAVSGLELGALDKAITEASTR